MSEYEIKMNFLELQYDFEFRSLSQGNGWYIRKLGTCKVEFLGTDVNKILERLNDLNKGWCKIGYNRDYLDSILGDRSPTVMKLFYSFIGIIILAFCIETGGIGIGILIFGWILWKKVYNKK